MSERRFARFYYPEFKRDYPDIYADDRAFAAWMRLLVGAEEAWPAVPELPRSVRAAALRPLTECGLVEVDGDRYSLKGFATERSRREDNARNAAAKRWHSDSNATASATAMPKRERRENEERVAATRASLDDDRRADLEAFLLVTRRAPTPRQRQLLDGLLDRHDLTGPQWAADIILRNPLDPIGAVIEADKAWRAERIAEAQAAEKPKPQPRRARGLPQSARDILEELKRIDAEKGAA